MKMNIQQGDWLIPHGCQEPHQVKEISYQEDQSGRYTDITFDGKGFRGVWYYPDYCKPIPVTDEILSANFEKKGDRYGIWDDYFDFEIREFNDCIYIVNYHCCEMNLPDTQISNVCFVHELQQILRLLGIEKEIRL